MKPYLLIFLILFIHFKSYSCSCRHIPFEEAIEWADEIFTGRLIEIKEITSSSFDAPHVNQKHVDTWFAKFEIIKKWKGSGKKYVKVYQMSSSCGAEFSHLGRNYLVYARKEKIIGPVKFLSTWLCSRTTFEHNYYSSEETNYYPDIEKLNKKFPNPIKIGFINLDFLTLLYTVLILTIGFFIGYRVKKRTL